MGSPGGASGGGGIFRPMWGEGGFSDSSREGEGGGKREEVVGRGDVGGVGRGDGGEGGGEGRRTA